MTAIIQYNAGNIASVGNALTRLGCPYVVTGDPEQLRQADRVIFPGVGEAASAMRYLSAQGLDRLLPALTQPVLGICLGMQLMCRHTEEGNTAGLGIFDIDVKKFPVGNKVPHMGWNSLVSPSGALFSGCAAGEDVYFVHSYYAGTGKHTVAEARYTLPFSAALQKDNFYAVQFHPEKSALTGQSILKNFLTL